MNEKIQLANTMKDSKLVSDKYIYEYIFNMTEEQWLAERTNVIEDLKLRFRQNQIEQEGNDPTVTGMSYGTPHDLASMHMGTDSDDQGGRPPEGIKSGQHRNAFGWDPLGTKQIKQSFDPQNQKTTFQPDPQRRPKIGTWAKTESSDILKKIKKSTSTKLLYENKETDTDSGTMLDENNIL
jgi:hypothetical protein